MSALDKIRKAQRDLLHVFLTGLPRGIRFFIAFVFSTVFGASIWFMTNHFLSSAYPPYSAWSLLFGWAAWGMSLEVFMDWNEWES